MAFRFIRNILDRIVQYLPDDEITTEEEREYEACKERIYKMHETVENLFYAEQAWIDGTEAKAYGEMAKGGFHAGENVEMLDAQGNVLMNGVISRIEEEQTEEYDPELGVKRYYLIFDERNISGKEDFFVRTYYIAKNH